LSERRQTEIQTAWVLIYYAKHTIFDVVKTYRQLNKSIT